MARMVRKQIYIPKWQDGLVKRMARERKISEAELIREAIDRALHGSAPRAFRRDPEAWEKAERLMQARRSQASGEQPYRWDREDAYVERESRQDRNQ